MSLSDILGLVRNLVQHWELLNGCASSEAHICPLVLRSMADAISRILALYEMAIEGVPGVPDSRERGLRPSYRDAANPSYAAFTPRSNSMSARNKSEQGRSLSCNTTPTFVGSLELDDEEEIAIVGQEALRHSIIRLGAMPQDIEETRQYDPDELSDAEQSLQDKEVKELIWRLFRLLGRLNGPAGIQY
ncbi:hypothetical protein K432DRAFT_386337 [Lepidopterella palustris CBS 459.81]|uniref:Uncharacterized protein n=1 Tax=Lepidopterella palustris CBS 459.81 TaxID=1314670 RepID=A0A8E2E0P8_9PEZI|nr:hypothetical protein K432DRAFT_386337 [Lepidopterella palustris CBS 459.81]